MTKSLNQSAQEIMEWADNKGIATDGNMAMQVLKLVEEAGELAGAVAKGNKAAAADALGDLFIGWVITATRMGLDVNTIVEDSCNIVLHRQGKVIDGVFVKESDLTKGGE